MDIKTTLLLAATGVCLSFQAMDKVKSEKIHKYLFEALNPVCMPPEYGTAIASKDFDTALKVAVHYFRTRPRPAFFDGLEKMEYDRDTALKAAQGKITVVNIEHHFPDGRIDYLYNPTEKSGACNPEWQWQLNRMYFWNDMALEYLHSGNEKVASAFDFQLSTWVTTMPCPQSGWKKRSSAWRTIETGLRLMGSWQTAFEVFRKSASVSDESIALMLSSMYEQAIHALEHRTRKNWLMMELNGVHTFAVLFPEFRSSSDMRKQSSALLGEEFSRQLLPDGMHNELSPDYHSVVVNCCSMLYRTAKNGGRLNDLPEDFSKNLERAAEALIHLTTPGFTQPRTNDCYTLSIANILKNVYEFFPHRRDFLWAVTQGRSGEAPAGKTASRFLAYAGFVAMRSSWKRDAAYLCFDVGPLGVGHMHQDKLNINIYKGDEELLFDDGGGQYEDSPYRKYAVSGAGHNTILVDGQSQYRKFPLTAEKAADAGFVSNEKFDYARGFYNDGFGESSLKTASHLREVLFVKPDFFAVADTVESMDGKAHDYTMLLQMDTRQIEISPKAVRGVLKGKYDLYIMTLCSDVSVKVESGETSPVSGWFVGRNREKLHPASTVKVTAAKKEKFKFVTLFFPLEKSGKAPEVRRISENKWEVIFNGKTCRLDLDDFSGNIK